MKKRISASDTAKWFLIIVGAIIIFLFWKVIEPYAIVLVTAGIFGVILSPFESFLKKFVKSRHLSAFITSLLVFLVVLLPLFLISILLVQEAAEVINWSISQALWLQSFDISQNFIFMSLPEAVQSQILAIDFVEIGRNVAEWVVAGLDNVLSRSAQLIFNTFIFFMALYYFLADKEKIYNFALEVSPLKDKLDAKIVDRIVHTVRSVVFSALIVASVQAVLATIGMTIFGVPGALLWGAIVIVAAQIPSIGVGLVMIPAISYLALTGSVWSAVGLLIWSVIVVGLIDNVLSPLILGARTKMPELLILISVLGGLQLFGPIGFILGPTILACVMVLVDLYRNGYLGD